MKREEALEYPVGAPLSREFWISMLTKTCEIRPRSGIREIRMSPVVSFTLCKFDPGENYEDIAEKADKEREKEREKNPDLLQFKPLPDNIRGYPIIISIDHKPEKSVTVIREDGLQVTFPVDC